MMGISKDLADFLELEKYDYDPVVESKVVDPYEDIDDYDYLEGNSSYYSLIKCPSCKRAYNIIHFDCGEYIDQCTCPKDVSESVYYCTPCDVIWDVSTDEVLENFSQETGLTLEGLGVEPETQISIFDDYDSYYDASTSPYSPDVFKEPVSTGGKWGVYNQNNKNKGKGPVTTTTTTATTYKSCKHKHVEIKLLDGTPIYCSSARDKAADGKVPDFGLYADSMWRPLWRNEFITWPDYGIPTDEEMGLTQIFDAYQRAKNGEMVEIGCIGGHGRTGTILAIMYIASGEGSVDGKDAYKFVKKNYCEHAIESDTQEWYIEYASSFWYGTELPEKPKPPAASAYNGTAWCGATDHFAMMLRGHHKCSDKGDSCKYWSTDLGLYNKKPEQRTQTDYSNFYTALTKVKNYDYVYGGLVRFDDDYSTNGCSPLDHYVMIMLGHEHCIRLEDECTFWHGDYKDWVETGTINNESNWSDIGAAGKALYELYPTVEEYKILQEINGLFEDETIYLESEKKEVKK